MQLESIEVTGSPKEMGRQTGEAFRERIQRFVEMRIAAVEGYFRDRRQPKTWRQLLSVGQVSFAVFQDWDTEGFAEQLGIAEGAGVDPATLFCVANMTDMRDALLLSAASGEKLVKYPEEGCSSVVVPAKRSKGALPLAGQTWDLNPQDVEFVVAIHRKPSEGLATWSVTCTGCLSLMGINERGVSVGTTNLKTYGSRAGVGYLSILHRAIRCESADEASRWIRDAPHAGAHTYWVADVVSQRELEASPNAVALREAKDALWRTNHCLAPPHQALEGEEVGESSLARFERIEELVSRDEEIDREALISIFADRSRGPLSVNRYAEDGQGTATNAVFIASPGERKAWACRGPADRGEWRELSFQDD